jgi:hypothetical protein
MIYACTAKLKELKAKKIVLEFEYNQQEQKLDELRKEHNRKIQLGNELFNEWITARMNNYNYIQEVTTEELPSFQHAELTQLPTQEGTTSSYLAKDSTEERLDLYKRLQQTRKAYLKLAKYMEGKEQILEDLREEREGQKQLHFTDAYEQEIHALEMKRRESEKRTDEYRIQLIDIKQEVDKKQKDMKLMNKRIEKSQIRTAREIQFLAKQLLK